MTDTNEITGARLTTKVPTEEYKAGWDRIFGKKKEKDPNRDSITWEDDLYKPIEEKGN